MEFEGLNQSGFNGDAAACVAPFPNEHVEVDGSFVVIIPFTLASNNLDFELHAEELFSALAPVYTPVPAVSVDWTLSIDNNGNGQLDLGDTYMANNVASLNSSGTTTVVDNLEIDAGSYILEVTAFSRATHDPDHPLRARWPLGSSLGRVWATLR